MTQTMDADIDALERELDFARNAARSGPRSSASTPSSFPVLPLFFGSEAHVWPLWLHGVVPTGHNQPSSLAVEGVGRR